jgi:hypothetical protein
LERLLDERKHIAFLVCEMSPASTQGGLQPGPGARERFDFFNFRQESVEFLVVMVNASPLVVILQEMFHRDVREIILLRAVVMEQTGDHPA